MRSTGEVMGIDASFGLAFAKAQMAVGFTIPRAGRIFISVHDIHKERIAPIALRFREMGFELLATQGTAAYLRSHDIPAETVHKVSEGRPHIVDRIKNGDVAIVINTSVGRRPTRDAYFIRRSALTCNILYSTTIAGAGALCEAVTAVRQGDWDVKPLQAYHFTEIKNPVRA